MTSGWESEGHGFKPWHLQVAIELNWLPQQQNFQPQSAFSESKISRCTLKNKIK